jgi:hypothetical protein
MRNRIFLFGVLFAVLLAAIAVMVARREEVKDILGDAVKREHSAVDMLEVFCRHVMDSWRRIGAAHSANVRWFNYFIHVHLPGNPGGQS